MTDRRKYISIIGLPEAGKTTLLAALWHIVDEDVRTTTKLRFNELSRGNYEHLNAIRRLWRAGRIQARTSTSGLKTVAMELANAAGEPVQVTFPDAPGEEYGRMWEERVVDEALAATLAAPGIALVINADTISYPLWVAQFAAVRRAGRMPLINEEPAEWEAKHAPTQVQVVDLLQHLMQPPLFIGPRRIALLFSAWDQVIEEGLTPGRFLKERLPLLDQYLGSAREGWSSRVWGVSAQGGNYDDPAKGIRVDDAVRLRQLDHASERIMVVSDAGTSNDLTEPLEWLMS